MNAAEGVGLGVEQKHKSDLIRHHNEPHTVADLLCIFAVTLAGFALQKRTKHMSKMSINQKFEVAEFPSSSFSSTSVKSRGTAW